MSIECLGNKSDLCVGVKVLVAFAKALKNRGGSGKRGNNLVVSARDVLKHKGFQRSIIGLPSAVAFHIGSDIMLRKRTVKPVGEAMAISDKCHLKAPFFPIGFRAIKTEIHRPGKFRYELHSWKRLAGSKRGNGRQLRSLGGCCSRRVGPRAQRGIIAHRGRR